MGVLRETSIAYSLGASWASDAYYVAVVPVFMLIDLGTDLSLALIPLYIGWQATIGRPVATVFFRLVARWVRTLAGLATLVICTTVRLWLPRVAPGLPDESAEQVERMIWILLPAMAFVLPALLWKAGANAHHRMIVPALAGLAPSIGVIAGSAASKTALGVSSVAVGLALGLLLQALVLWRTAGPSLGRAAGELVARSQRRGILVEFFGSWALVLVGSSMYKIEPFVQRYYGSLLGAGEISNLTYAYRIASLPNTLFTLAVATVIFPTLAAHGAARSGELQRLIRRVVAWSAVLLTLVAFGMLVLRNEVIAVLLRHGKFTAADAGQTAENLRFYCLCIAPLGLAMMLVRCVCVLRAVWLYSVGGLLSAAVYLATAHLLVRAMGAEGLALASAAGNAVLCGFLLVSVLVLLQRRKERLVR